MLDGFVIFIGINLIYFIFFVNTQLKPQLELIFICSISFAFIPQSFKISN